jgi:hypothetical protein
MTTVRPGRAVAAEARTTVVPPDTRSYRHRSPAWLPRGAKDPDEKLDYAVDWSAWLPAGDTLASAAWTVPTGITQATPAPSIDDTTATVWLSGGTAGQSYPIACRVTTAQGRIVDRTLTILVTNRCPSSGYPPPAAASSPTPPL